MYRTFVRTWWKNNPKWPDGLEPKAGTKIRRGNYFTIEEAREACKRYNDYRTTSDIKYGRKMEFEKI